MRAFLTVSLCYLAGAAAIVCADDSLATPGGHTLTTRGGPVACSPDGRMVLTGDAEGEITVWDVRSGKRVRTVSQPASVLRSVAWSPDGHLLAAAGSLNEVRLWDAETGRAAGILKGHTAVIHSIAFSPDGKTLASGSSDKTVRLWDVATRRETFALSQPGPWPDAPPSQGTPGSVFDVAFSPDGKLVADGGGDGTAQAGELVLWEAATGRQHRRLLGPDQRQVWAVAFTPDGSQLVCGFIEGSVRLFDVETGKMLRAFDGGDQLRGLAISRDGRTIATAIRREIQLWDAGTLERKRTLRGHGNWVLSIAFSPDGTYLVSGCSDGTVKLWSLAF